MELELLVRAAIVNQGKFLIAHTKGASNTYLPGGHVKVGEGLKQALARELDEELGIPVTVGRFLGTVEHAWSDANGLNHEINHLFEVTSPELGVDRPSESLEDYIEFFWLTPSEFEEHNLQPAPLRKLLMNLGEGSRGIWWASTVEPADS
ncbi:MAG: NUDIX domain-containing protein [Anaerolineales bacterium]